MAQPDLSSLKTFIELSSQIIILVVGIGAIIGLVKGGYQTLKSIKTMANIVNSFMVKILPDILKGFEKEDIGIVPPGTLVDWTKTVSSEKYSTRSLKRLNKSGLQLLKDSGMQENIDTHLDTFIRELEKRKLETLLDLEDQSFYVLKNKEEEILTIPLKNYLYDHPAENMDIILFVGSVYLHEEYLKKHPEILENYKKPRKNVTDKNTSVG